MSPLPELHPVVKAPWFEGAPPWLWPVAPLDPLSWIRLSGEMSELEIGSVMAQLVSYNSIRVRGEKTIPKLLARVSKEEGLILPGGLQASADGRVLHPGCCCGLEEWRAWGDFLRTGVSPWMGHDPEGWLERRGGEILAHSAALEPAPISFEEAHFSAELARVEAELRGFLAALEGWARSLGAKDPAALCRSFNASFLREVVSREDGDI